VPNINLVLKGSKMTRIISLACLSLILLAPTTFAQELEEIVVTARKVEESLQKVPITVTAFTSEQLTELMSAPLRPALASKS
jgi:outer membrane receptor protein involved in Fe transport